MTGETMIMNLRDRFDAAATYREFVAAATANRDLWESMTRRARVAEASIERVGRVGGQWHLLALAEDWCGDAVSTIPYVAALADAAPNVDLRVLGRDDNPDLMDTHLTTGSRSIPVILILDSAYREVGWWGPRPDELQAWVTSEGVRLPKDARYHEVRRWYARDRGVTTIDEIVGALECRAAIPRAA
jgi:hypothetical protein